MQVTTKMATKWGKQKKNSDKQSKCFQETTVLLGVKLTTQFFCWKKKYSFPSLSLEAVLGQRFN